MRHDLRPHVAAPGVELRLQHFVRLRGIAFGIGLGHAVAHPADEQVAAGIAIVDVAVTGRSQVTRAGARRQRGRSDTGTPRGITPTMV